MKDASKLKMGHGLLSIT